MITALAVGLAAAGSTFVIRAIIDTMNPTWLLSKPFACDLCMNWWASLGLGAWSAIDSAMPLGESAQLVLGATAVGVLATKAANRLAT
jgi:hypothetical protein